MAIRTVYVYVKTPTTMDKLKSGDIFSMDPASEADKEYADPGVLFLATSAPEHQEGKPEDHFQIFGEALSTVKGEWKSESKGEN